MGVWFFGLKLFDQIVRGFNPVQVRVALGARLNGNICEFCLWIEFPELMIKGHKRTQHLFGQTAVSNVIITSIKNNRQASMHLRAPCTAAQHAQQYPGRHNPCLLQLLIVL